MGVRGWVYVISNPAIPGLVKIGFSTKDPLLRAEELNHTGLPNKFIVEYDVLVDSPHQIEQKVHKALSDCRYSKEKEFFKCSSNDAVQVIRKICDGLILLENNRIKDQAKREELFTVNGVSYTRSEIENDPNLSWRFAYLLKSKR